MSLKGVDTEALQRLVDDMFGCRSDLEMVLSSLTGELDALPWAGPDRNRFVQEWGTQSSHLNVVIQVLREAAEGALRHIQQQESVSRGGAS